MSMFYIAGVLQVPEKHHSREVIIADALILFILDPICWAGAHSQVVQTARKCLVSPRASKTCSSLPRRRLLTFQAAAPALRRRRREAPSSACRTNTRRRNQIKRNKTQLVSHRSLCDQTGRPQAGEAATAPLSGRFIAVSPTPPSPSVCNAKLPLITWKGDRCDQTL